MTLKFIVLVVLLAVISIIDYRSLIIPDELLLIGAALYVALSLFADETVVSIMMAILSGCAVALPLLLFVLLADRVTGKETMGFGDIKLLFLIGMYLGAAKVWLTLFISCLVGLLWYGLQRNRSDAVMPFGPSISIAALIVMAWGTPILNWYSGFFV